MLVYSVSIWALDTDSLIATAVQPEEAKYFLELCNAAALATVPGCARNAQAIGKPLAMPWVVSKYSHSTSPSQQFPGILIFDLDTVIHSINPEKGFMMLYKSGSTGSSKGVLNSLQSATIGFEAKTKAFGIMPKDTWLQYSPVHHASGFQLLYMKTIIWSCTEVRSRSQMSPDWLIERVQPDDSICLFLLPPFCDSMGAKFWSNEENRHECLLESQE